jgi:hypothetical protein
MQVPNPNFEIPILSKDVIGASECLYLRYVILFEEVSNTDGLKWPLFH